MAGPDRNIAVVLPDAAVRRQATSVLVAGGYSVSTAADFDSAIRLLDSGPPIDLALVAIRLGGGPSGFVLLRELRYRNEERPVVVLCAEPSVEDVVAAFRLGADDVLVEPLRGGELLCVVDRAFGVAADEAAERSGLHSLSSGAFPAVSPDDAGQDDGEERPS